MILQDEIEINEQIMKLIRKKHRDQIPGNKASPDYRYYMKLERDNEKAKDLLNRVKEQIPA